jgi:hypothetical protein
MGTNSSYQRLFPVLSPPKQENCGSSRVERVEDTVRPSFMLNSEFSHVAVPGHRDTGRIREWERWPMLYEKFYDAADADLLLVAEGLEPSGELVGALNGPRHRG